MNHPKVFIFSKTDPELNVIVLFGKSGRTMELPIGFDVNGVVIDQNNEEEFHCEEERSPLGLVVVIN